MQPLLASGHLHEEAAVAVSLACELDTQGLSIQAGCRCGAEKPHSKTNLGKKLNASGHEAACAQMLSEQQDANQTLPRC